MASRRAFMGYDQSSLSQPSSSMTPGVRTQNPVTDDSYAQQSVESPDTMRRRITPVTGAADPGASTLQALLSMLRGEQ